MNIARAEKVVTQLVEQGVRTFCLCPGARNAPFIEVLKDQSQVEIVSFFDERSASFFAFGMARKQKRPVAVVTTSGTAVSELLSSCIEAHYNCVPIVLVTADRPKRLRGTGAPQAIYQNKLLESYCHEVWDFGEKDSVEFQLSSLGPNHLNICFDEPLIDSKVSRQWAPQSFKPSVPLENFRPEMSLSKPLVIVSGLSELAVPHIKKSLQNVSAPIFLEAQSGLRGRKEEGSHWIEGGEKIIGEMLRSGQVQSILRIGDVPLGRYWRDLENMKIPVVSISNKPFPGLSHGQLMYCDLQSVDLSGIQFETWGWLPWLQRGVDVKKQIVELARTYPLSESAFYKYLSDRWQESWSLYLGNSLPVRIWDLFCERSVIAGMNRGANGIDGQIASAFGGFQKNSKNWLVIGDLTTLYDQNSLWLSDYLKKKNIHVNLVVVNNRGGQIFKRIFSSSLYCNDHHLNFEGLAQQWGWSYCRAESWEELPEPNGLRIIEVLPNREQSEQFWQSYDLLWT